MFKLLQENNDAILQEDEGFILLDFFSNLTIKGNTTFAVGDILRIKDGTDDEWMEVINIDFAPSYTIIRDKAADYAADTNPTWKKGATVVNYKQSGDGGVYMTASDSNAPYLSIFDHAGVPWTTINTRLRIGNLNGYLGYSTDLYGIGIGEATKYLKYDTTNGLRIMGDITATSGKFGTTTNYWSVGATGLTAVAASTDVIINYGKTDFGQDATNGFILGYDYSASVSKLEIGSSATKLFKYDGTDFTLIGGIITAGTVRTAASGSRIQLNSSANRLELYRDAGIIGYFGNLDGNGSLLYINYPASTGSYSPIYINNADDSAVITVNNTAGERGFVALANSNAGVNTTGCAIQAHQAGTSSIYGTNVAGCYCTKGGVWTDTSSKIMKENFEDIKVLDIIKNLDIKRYNYISEKRQNKTEVKDWLINRSKRQKYSQTKEGRKSGINNKEYLKEKLDTNENTKIEKELIKEYAQELKRKVPKHISPMAEDFYKAFGVGDDKGISPKDLAGVAIQGIKELISRIEKLELK